MSSSKAECNRFFTIGYEGRSLDELLQAMRSHDVRTLVDVRERALSRKRGFSKTALKEAAEQAGIGYVHFRQLGSPKELRYRLKTDWNYGAFFREYVEYLETQDAALLELTALIDESACCLLCYERDVRQCHRSKVSEAVIARAGRPLTPVHL